MSAITRGLSPHTVAVSCAIPAARASAASSLARIGSDAAALVVVRDREGDLGGSPLADEPRDPDRLRVAVGIPDEDVTVVIDPCERRELEVGETRLRAAEAALSRAVAETREQCGDRLRVPVSQCSNREPVDVA